MNYTIKVNKGDIIHGRRHNCTDCAVARAVRRAVGNDSLVIVGRDAIRVNGVALPVSEEVQSNIVAIDAGWGKLVRPFEFTLDVPEQPVQVAA